MYLRRCSVCGVHMELCREALAFLGSLRMVTSALLRRKPVLGALQKLRMKTEEENRVHMEIKMFLKKEQQVSLRDLWFLI